MAKRHANRFTKSDQISEPDFVVILTNFLLGFPASKLTGSSQVEATLPTVQKYYRLIRARLIDDETLCAWMGGGPNKLLPDDDPTWTEIYECVFSCKTAILNHIPIPSSDAIDEELPPPLSVADQIFYSYCIRMGHSKIPKKFNVPFIYSKTTCQNCPLEYEPDIAFHLYINELLTMRAVYQGIPKKSFKKYFFEAALRVNLRTANSKYRPMTLTDFIALFLVSCEANKI